MSRSIVLLVVTLVLISSSTSLAGLTQTLSGEFQGGKATDIEVVDFAINNTVIFRVFRLNKIVFVMFNRDLMLGLGDEIYTVDVRKYGISVEDINVAGDKVREYFDRIERAESERIKELVKGRDLIEVAEERRRIFNRLSEEVIRILRSTGIDEIYIPPDPTGYELIYIPTYSLIVFSTVGMKDFNARSYIAVARGLATLANNYQDLVLVREQFIAKPQLLCVFNLHNKSKECEEVYGRLREIPCYLHVGVNNFWGPIIFFNKTCVVELATIRGRSVDDTTNEILEKVKMIVREIRRIDPALTRVMIWIEHATPIVPQPMPLSPEVLDESNTASDIRSIPKVDVIKRNITMDELDKVFDGDRFSGVVATQSTGVSVREAVDKTMLVYAIIAIPIVIVAIYISKKRLSQPSAYFTTPAMRIFNLSMYKPNLLISYFTTSLLVSVLET